MSSKRTPYKPNPKVTIKNLLPDDVDMLKDGTIVDKKTRKIISGVAQETNKNGTAGHPTKYKPEFLDDLKIHMRNGGSLQTFVGFLINRYDKVYPDTKELIAFLPKPSTVYEWANEKSPNCIPEFMDTHRALESAYQFYWTDIASKGNKVPTGKWTFSMANRFGWNQKTDVTSGGEKIEAPVLYKPEKHKQIDGVIMNEDPEQLGDGS